MKNSVYDDAAHFDRVEHSEGKPADENAPKRSKLDWTYLGMADDERHRRVDAT